MAHSRLTVLRVRGIPISISWSWVPIAVFLIWSLGTQIFPRSFLGLSSGTYLGMAVTATLLFFVSVVLHELGHAFRALKEGMRIEGITLWLFGGVARFTEMFPSAAAELRIASAGPAASAAVTAVFGGLAAASIGLGLPLAVRGIAVYLAAINLLLLAFNLIPALPLDGGRMLRAFIWKRRGDFTLATRITAALGQGLGLVLSGIGIAALLVGSFTTGLALSLLGIFVVQAAKAEASYGAVDRALAGIRVRDLLGPNQAVIAPASTVEAFLAATAGPFQRTAYPVASGGELVGIVSTEAAKAVAAPARTTRTVAETMAPANGVPVLSGDMPALDALNALRASSGSAAIREGGTISGMVSVPDIARALQVRLQRRASAWRTQRAWVLGGLIAVLALLLGIGLGYHPPLYVVSPGPVTDISHDLTINQMPARVPSGHFLLVTVQASQHALFEDLFQAFHPHRQLIATSAVGSLAHQDDLFQESRVLAAAAAGQAAGLHVVLSGDGAEVTGVVPRSPAAGVLRTGDIVVGVNGTAIHTEFDLEEAIGAQPAGSRFTLSVRRDGTTAPVGITSTRIEGDPAIGVQLLTRNLAIAGPFTISFAPRDIGGPSAGLVYALAVSDAIGNLNSNGRTIAATGTIDQSGDVGEVGDVDLKAIGANAQGARTFIVPASEVGQAKGLIPDVRGVASLQEALASLKRSP